MAALPIAVLYGGFTSERNISLQSGRVVFDHIDRKLFKPYLVRIDEDAWVDEASGKAVDLNDFSVSSDGDRVRLKGAFIALHGSPGEDGKVQSYLDLKQVPYACCDPVTCAITFNKFFCKQIVKDRVKVPAGILVTDSGPETRERIQATFNLPVFIKPNTNGSSYGVTRLTEWENLEAALTEGFEYDKALLVEELVTGTEVTCGVYSEKGKTIALPICEIAVEKHAFFNYTAKYTQGECDEIIPARIPDDQAAEITRISKVLYTQLNCKGVVRIDYIIRDDVPVFLEVNTVPGLSEASIVPKMVQAAGSNLRTFFATLLQESL